jgi:hypothetical protein
MHEFINKKHSRDNPYDRRARFLHYHGYLIKRLDIFRKSLFIINC